jgi:hypothetical protein
MIQRRDFITLLGAPDRTWKHSLPDRKRFDRHGLAGEATFLDLTGLQAGTALGNPGVENVCKQIEVLAHLFRSNVSA